MHPIRSNSMAPSSPSAPFYDLLSLLRLKPNLVHQLIIVATTAAIEDRQFRSFFDTRQEIVKMVWDMLGEGGLHPKNSEPKQLLWALYCMKLYPREGPGCSAVGGSKGAIDPKIIKKWVWLFLE